MKPLALLGLALSLSAVSYTVPASADASFAVMLNFTQNEAMEAFPNFADLLRLPVIKSTPGATSDVQLLSSQYDALLTDPNTSSPAFIAKLRQLSIAKAQLYKNYGISELVLGVPVDEVDSYIAKWQAHWATEDRIQAEIKATVIKPVNKKVPSSALQLSAGLKQLLNLGVDTEQFDIALVASTKFAGANPDDLKRLRRYSPNCVELFRSDSVVGGGYAIDGKGLKIDKCASNTTITINSCPEPKPFAAPAPSPNPLTPETGEPVALYASAKTVSCPVNTTCKSVLAPDRTVTARCE